MENIIEIPSKLKIILMKDQSIYTNTLHSIEEYCNILRLDEHKFFSEYTNHGITHVQDLLKTAQKLIHKSTMRKLKPIDISILITSSVLHDIAMQLPFTTFKKMLEGKYDGIKNSYFDEMTWKELWEDYLSEARHFSQYQKEKITGDSLYKIKILDLDNPSRLYESDYKFIGEFVRRHHSRIAHEIAIYGIQTHVNIKFGEKLEPHIKDIIGLTARSHGIDIRSTFEYLRHKFTKYACFTPYEIKIIYIMAILRIADYLQIDKGRILDGTTLNIMQFTSSFSENEHMTHQMIDKIQYESDTFDKESIVIMCSPQNSKMYIKLKKLFADIQKELDVSWAVLGEVYGGELYKMNYRRIRSNIDAFDYIEQLNYVPQELSFRFKNNLASLLIAPLYGDNASFGVRELLQNAVDACIEMTEINKTTNKEYHSKVTLGVNEIEGRYIFKISDNGKGMNIYEIKNYFLVIGSSSQNDLKWKKIAEKEGVYRIGRFGVGVLASFLIGDNIEVRTKSYCDPYEYYFKTSLYSENIEVLRKECDKASGTEISIEISKSKVLNLLHSVDLYNYTFLEAEKINTNRNLILWHEWYKLDNPSVEYIFKGEMIKYDKLSKSMLCHVNAHNKYGSVYWLPIPIDSEVENMPCLYCNGILLSKEVLSKIELGKKYVHYDNIISLVSMPHIFLEDRENKLPISLDRSRIDLNFDDFNFIEELYNCIIKDFIAQIITIGNIEKILKIKCFNWINSINQLNAFFVFTSTGYCLSTAYTLTCLRKKYERIVFLLTEHLTIDMLIKIARAFPSIAFIPIQNYEIFYLSTNKNILGQSLNILEIFAHNIKENDIRILLNSIRINNLFVNGKQNNTQAIYEYRKHPQLRINYYSGFIMQDSLLMRIAGLFIKDKIDSLTLVEYLFDENIGQETCLDKKLCQYFNGDVIIPYAMDERMNKCKFIFNELREYIRNY